MRTPTYENYGIYPHQQIWDEMYGGAGPGSQGEVMVGWRRLAENLTRIRDYVDSAVGGVRASHQGSAADAEVAAMVPMGAWVAEAQRLVNDTRNRIDDQISVFTWARDSVPEVPPEPRGGGWREIPGIDSFTTSDQEIDEAFNVEQERQARAVMMAYQNDSNERMIGVPYFAPPPTGEPNISAPTARRSEIGGFPGGVGGGSAGGGVPTSPAGVGGGTSTELSAVSPPVGDAVVPPLSGGPVPPSGGGSVGPPVSGGPVVLPPGGRPVPPHAGGRPVVPLPGAGSRGPGSGGVGAGRGGPGGSAGMRGGSGIGGLRPHGGAPGVGGFGPDRGAGGFGPTGSPESAAARAAGSASAGAGGAGAAGSGAAGTGAAGRGGGSAGGVPFGGMGAGRGGEDGERQRPSYLVEPDSNRLIGELPWTAPAVIGEDPLEYDESDRR